MSETDQDIQQTPRITGYTARMGERAEVKAWGPPSRAEVDAMPPLPRRPVRGWKLGGTQAELDSKRHPTQGAVPRAEPEAPAQPPSPPPAEEAAPAPPAEPVRPQGIEEGSIQALIWDRPADAAKLVRTMLLEEEEEGMPDLPLMQKVAIVMVALGEEVSGEVMKHLSDYEIEEITQTIASLKNIPLEIVNRVLEEFKQHLMAGEWVGRGGVDFARATLERAVGPRKAQEILERVTAKVSSGFNILKNVAPEQIAPFISHEHPQTIALILSQLDAPLAGGILNQFPQSMQPDVAYRIATMENIPPAVIKQIEESLETSLRDMLVGDQDVGGPKVIADILNCTGSSVEKNVLDQMDGQDPEVAEAVRNLMFIFEDIAKLSDREIQTLLREVDPKDLTISLKAASEEMKKKILGNMSEEAAKKLTEDMEFLGPMRLSEVEEVQLRIVQQVRQLEEQGQITIVKGDAEDQFV